MEAGKGNDDREAQDACRQVIYALNAFVQQYEAQEKAEEASAQRTAAIAAKVETEKQKQRAVSLLEEAAGTPRGGLRVVSPLHPNPNDREGKRMTGVRQLIS